jgi:hypothetical protein
MGVIVEGSAERRCQMKKILYTLLLLAAIAPAQALAQNTFSGQATVVSGTLLGTPIQPLVDTGPVPSSGGTLESSLLDLNIPGTLDANVGHATVVAMGDASRSEASLAKLNVTINGNTIGANFLMARAAAFCTDGGAATSGRSDIVQLVINGNPIDISVAPNPIVLPGGVEVFFDQEKSSVNGNHAEMDVTALEIVVPPLGGLPATDLKIATAHADITCTGAKSCPQDKDFITGGGRISVNASGGKASFGVAGGMKNGGFWGHLTYIDHATGMKVKGTGVTAYTAPDLTKPTLRHIEGNCEIDGAVGTYKIDVDDEGEPGTSDTFYIQLSNGYKAGSTLDGGNIQLHICK